MIGFDYACEYPITRMKYLELNQSYIKYVINELSEDKLSVSRHKRHKGPPESRVLIPDFRYFRRQVTRNCLTP